MTLSQQLREVGPAMQEQVEEWLEEEPETDFWRYQRHYTLIARNLDTIIAALEAQEAGK